MPLVSSMCKASTKLQKLTGSIDGIWNRSRTPPSCYAFLGVERVETYICKRISSNFGFGSFEIGFLIFLTEIIPAFLLRWNNILTRWAAPATLNMQRSTTQLVYMILSEIALNTWHDPAASFLAQTLSWLRQVQLAPSCYIPCEEELEKHLAKVQVGKMTNRPTRKKLLQGNSNCPF